MVGWQKLFNCIPFIFGFNCSGQKLRFCSAQDGSGDFSSIQLAIDAIKAFPDSSVHIYVKNGTYKEKILVPSCNSHLTITGQTTEGTFLTWDDQFDKINRGRNSTFYTYTLKVEADNFILENMTV